MDKTMEKLNDFKERKEAIKLAGSKIRYGIIGTGWIAEDHVRSLKKIADVEIVAACDLVPNKAKNFFDKFELPQVRCYEDYHEMFEKERLDAISVCTYNATHAECTIYALSKGVNVLCEKPMCITLEEAKAMRKAEKNSGKILSIGFQPRMDENMKNIKKIVDSGALGKVYYIQTGGGRRRGIPTPFGTSFIAKETAGIGAVGDIGCYSLDLALNAIGYPKPITVSGYTSNFFGTNPDSYEVNKEYSKVFGVDDFAAAFIRLEGDVILDFRIAWDMHLDSPGDTIIMGTKGSLRIHSTPCWNGTFEKPMKLYSRIAGNDTETEIPLISSSQDIFYEKILAFVYAVQTGGKAPVSTKEIIINQAIIDGIIKSAKEKREIVINADDLESFN